jgi:rod shape-determining protein MreC
MAHWSCARWFAGLVLNSEFLVLIMFRFWNTLNNFGRALILILASVCIIVLAEFRADFVIRNAIHFVTSPLAAVVSRTSHSFLGLGKIVGSISSLTKENQLLKDQNSRLQSENTRLQELQVENQHLREQLKLGEERSFELVSAGIIAKDPLGYAKHVTINRGSRDGLEEKMPVVAAEGMLVGYLSNVYTASSTVTLLSDPNIEKVPALIQTNRADGFVVGQELGQGLQMDLIEQDVEVSQGSTVITSGLNTTFPTGLVIGYVQSVNKNDNALFQQAHLLPALDYDHLEYVSVITNWPPE